MRVGRITIVARHSPLSFRARQNSVCVLAVYSMIFLSVVVGFIKSSFSRCYCHLVFWIIGRYACARAGEEDAQLQQCDRRSQPSLSVLVCYFWVQITKKRHGCVFVLVCADWKYVSCRRVYYPLIRTVLQLYYQPWSQQGLHRPTVFNQGNRLLSEKKSRLMSRWLFSFFFLYNTAKKDAVLIRASIIKDEEPAKFNEKERK